MMATRRAVTLTAALALLFFAVGANAGIIEDLANAVIIEDFQFDDPAGTLISDAANSANPGNFFDTDSDSDDVLTDGAGLLDATGKNNTAFAGHYVDNPGKILTGRVLGVMRLKWDFDTAVYDPAQDEEIRVTLINNPPRGTQVTAQVEINRTAVDVLEINGSATNGDPLGPASLPLTQTDDFIMVVDADLDADMYSVYYSANAGTSFTTLGTGAIDPSRGVEALRMVLNEDFVGDGVFIDRVYLATIPEPSSLLLAVVGLVGFARRRG